MRICFLAHEALSFDTRRSLLPIVIVVVVAAAQRDMKMPGARARGLVVNIRRCRRRVVDVAPTRHDMNTRWSRRRHATHYDESLPCVTQYLVLFVVAFTRHVVDKRGAGG